MAADDLFQIALKFSIECCAGPVRFSQCDGLGEQPSRLTLDRAKYGYWARILLNNNFRTCAHVRQQGRNAVLAASASEIWITSLAMA